MDVLIHSDGQLYPPKPKPPPPKKTPDPQPPPPPPDRKPEHAPPPPCRDRRPAPDLPWEDLLLVGVALLVLRNNDRPDLPLLLALAYILFDQQFDLKKLF